MKNRCIKVMTIRKLLIGACLAVAVAAAGGLWLGSKDTAVVNNCHEGIIRFHVIANSDSPADQALKLMVKDAVVKRMTPVLAGAGDIEEARHRVDAGAQLIETEAVRVLRENGCGYPVKVMRGNYDFPEKTYRIKDGSSGETAELTLPAGNYEAIRVIIGSGRGANWWCVLFPPLCFVNPNEAVPAEASGDRQEDAAGVPAFRYNPEQHELAQARPHIEYRFRIVDWYNQIKDWGLGLRG